VKYSIYNTFFNDKDQHVGYNSMTDTFVLISNELYNQLFPCGEILNAEYVQEKLPEFYSELIRMGFIVDDKKDEIAVALKIAKQTDEDNSVYSIIINPTMNCNFKCWYCYESHIVGSKMSNNVLESIKNHINKVVGNNNGTLKQMHIGWFGGEPLLYYRSIMHPLLEYGWQKANQKGITFSSNITTNGFFLNNRMLDDFIKYNLTHLQITLDGNRSRHNKVRCARNTGIGSYDTIVRNIKTCASRGLSVRIRINISKETLPGVEDIMNDFIDLSLEEREHIRFSFHEVWQEGDYMFTSIALLVEKFRKNNFYVLYRGEHGRSIFNTCYADKKSQVTINYNGDVFKCTARSFSPSKREGYLTRTGDIVWNEIYFSRFSPLIRTKNTACMKCSIFPVCNGGCSQQRIEHLNQSYCIFNFDDDKKTDFIRDKLSARLSAII